MLAGQIAGVNDVAFSRRGLLLASAGDDGSIRVWDLEASRELPTLGRGEDAVNSVAFPSGRQDARLRRR